MKRFRFGALVALNSLPLFALGCGTFNPTTIATQSQAAESQSPPEKVGAAYNAKGELIRPADHRE